MSIDESSRIQSRLRLRSVVVHQLSSHLDGEDSACIELVLRHRIVSSRHGVDEEAVGPSTNEHMRRHCL